MYPSPLVLMFYRKSAINQSVQLLSHVQLFMTPWIAALYVCHQYLPANLPPAAGSKASGKVLDLEVRVGHML